jgi:hypothetical protein
LTAEQRARELLRSVVPAEDWHAYEELGFISVAGRGDPASGYAYLVYPQRPLVSYETATGRLLSEHCARFRDGEERLPDADDVLAKWLALAADERGLIETANMDRPGRQLDPSQVQRNLATLALWKSRRGLPEVAVLVQAETVAATRTSRCASAAPSSSTAPTAPTRAPT